MRSCSGPAALGCQVLGKVQDHCQHLQVTGQQHTLLIAWKCNWTFFIGSRRVPVVMGAAHGWSMMDTALCTDTCSHSEALALQACQWFAVYC